MRVLVNGQQILEAPLLFDLTRHQLMLAASRNAHSVVSGSLLKPDLKTSTITINPSEVHQTMLGFGGSPSIAAYAELATKASAPTGRFSSATTCCSPASIRWARSSSLT